MTEAVKTLYMEMSSARSAPVCFHSTAYSFKHNLNMIWLNLITFDKKQKMYIYIYVCVSCNPLPTLLEGFYSVYQWRTTRFLFRCFNGEGHPDNDTKLYKFKVHLYIRRYVWHDMLIQICLFTFVEVYSWMHTFCILPYICLSNNYYPMDESPVIVCFSVVSQPWRTTYHHHWKLMNKLNPVPLLTQAIFYSNPARICGVHF